MKNKRTLTLAALAVLIAITISSADAIAANIDEGNSIPASINANLIRIDNPSITDIAKNIEMSISDDVIGDNIVADDDYIKEVDINITNIAAIENYAVENINVIERGGNI